MNKKITFSTTTKIHASKESVWEILLSADLYQTAWDAKLKTSWKPGTNIQFNGTWENVEYSDKGVVQIIEKNSFLKFSYWSSFWNAPDIPEEYCNISYKINSLDNFSCELTIFQEGFRDEKHYNDTVELWNHTFSIIKNKSEELYLTTLNNKVCAKLISMVDSISHELYNKPVPNGWNIAQVIEHIIMGNSDLKQFLTEKPLDSPTSYDINIPNIRAMMLNEKDKQKSPDFLIPSSKKYDKENHKPQLAKIQLEINDCIQTLDMYKNCGAFELPPFGLMSVYEWLNFSVFHISRHVNQIDQLVKKL